MALRATPQPGRLHKALCQSPESLVAPGLPYQRYTKGKHRGGIAGAPQELRPGSHLACNTWAWSALAQPSEHLARGQRTWHGTQLC
jgi:hypothetical protein